MSASSTPICVHLASPKLCRNRFWARSQSGCDCSSFCWPEGVSRSSLCRRSSPAFTPIHPRLTNSLSMRVKLVVSSASNLPRFPWVISPVRFKAISKVNCVSSRPVSRSSWLYIFVTARAVRRRLAQAQGNTGKVLSARGMTYIHVCTHIRFMSSRIEHG